MPPCAAPVIPVVAACMPLLSLLPVRLLPVLLLSLWWRLPVVLAAAPLLAVSCAPVLLHIL